MSMARNHSNDNDGIGCLIWILVIMWLLGNVALFSGSFADSPILIIITVIGDIIAIGAIIKAIADKPTKNSLSQASESNQTSTQQVETRSPSPTKTKPTTDVNEDYSKLYQLKAKYRVPNAPSVVSAVDPLQKKMESYQCVEVLQSINIVINLRRESAKKMQSLKDEIERILACPGCSTDKERLDYIKNNESALQQKKEAYMTASYKMKYNRVVLLTKGKAAFSKLSSALAEVISSEKSTSESGVALSAFIQLKSGLPGDLFVSEQNPIELDFGAYKFFLLPDVVLVYDKSNSFITALEPMALIITFKNQKKSVYTRRSDFESWSYSDTIIAKDSVLISEGSVRRSWLHEKKSGGPDLRYSYNPSHEARFDTYAYSDFSIQIGQYKAEYSLSKGNLSKKLKTMVKDYCSAMHEFNTIPSLLRLVESVAKKEEAAQRLSEQYAKVNKNIICKVR